MEGQRARSDARGRRPRSQGRDGASTTLTSFDSRVNNWDDEQAQVQVQRHQRSSTSATACTSSWATPTSCCRWCAGIITSADAEFPESGPSDASASAGTTAWSSCATASPGQRAEQVHEQERLARSRKIIAERNHLDAKVDTRTGPSTRGVQKNQDDAQFLMERAKRIDFDCFIANDPADRAGHAVLRAGPPTGATRGRVASTSSSGARA